MPSAKVENFGWLYAVSNHHVVQRDGFSVLRVNTNDGKIETIETEPHEWITFAPPVHDVAIYSMFGNLIPSNASISWILYSDFLTPDLGEKFNIGPGDDVFMVGRFVNHEGKARNFPSVRFGNLSMMPGDEPIYVDSKTHPQESFAIEMRSMCGYSGSPVFVHQTGMRRSTNGDIQLIAGYPDLLLGVHWGHIVDPWAVKKRIVKRAETAALRPGEVEVDEVAANTGMNGVVPVWRLAQLMNSPQLVAKRQSDEAEMIEKLKRDQPGAVLDSAKPVETAAPPANDANPTHREDFTRLVGAAARKPEPKD
jgi:hypothetical protein